MKKELYNQEKQEGYNRIVFSLADAYYEDSDTNFIEHAQKACRRLENYLKVYNYLYRNRTEIHAEARRIGSQRLHESECNDAW